MPGADLRGEHRCDPARGRRRRHRLDGRRGGRAAGAPSSAGCATCVRVVARRGPRRRRSPRRRWRWSARARRRDQRPLRRSARRRDDDLRPPSPATVVVTVDGRRAGPVRSAPPSSRRRRAQPTVAADQHGGRSDRHASTTSSTTLADDAGRRPTGRPPPRHGADDHHEPRGRSDRSDGTAPVHRRRADDHRPTRRAPAPDRGTADGRHRRPTTTTAAAADRAPRPPPEPPTTARARGADDHGGAATSQPQYGGTLSLSRGRPNYIVTVQATATDGLPAGTTISFCSSPARPIGRCDQRVGRTASGAGRHQPAAPVTTRVGHVLLAGAGAGIVGRRAVHHVRADLVTVVRIVAQRPGGQPATAVRPAGVLTGARRTADARRNGSAPCHRGLTGCSRVASVGSLRSAPCRSRSWSWLTGQVPRSGHRRRRAGRSASRTPRRAGERPEAGRPPASPCWCRRTTRRRVIAGCVASRSSAMRLSDRAVRRARRRRQLHRRHRRRGPRRRCHGARARSRSTTAARVPR